MDQDERRTRQIIDVLTDAFADLMEADPAAFRRKYRTMAADPFAFYRGTACLFYADLEGRDDRWADERTSRVWIRGDLHVENFGTYMNGEGVLVFDVNDYDEAYLGHFTWDLLRLAASLAVLGWTKALPDADITRLIEVYLRAYLDQVHSFVDNDRDHEWSLRLGTATGAVQEALLTAQLSTRSTCWIGSPWSRTTPAGSGTHRRFASSTTTNVRCSSELSCRTSTRFPDRSASAA